MKALIVTAVSVIMSQFALALPIDESIRKLEQQGVSIDRSRVDPNSSVLCLVDVSKRKKILLGFSNDSTTLDFAVVTPDKKMKVGELVVALNAFSYSKAEMGGLDHHATVMAAVTKGGQELSRKHAAHLTGYIPALRTELSPFSVKSDQLLRDVTGVCGYTDQ